jgi:uncharacterized membrane protein YfcA
MLAIQLNQLQEALFKIPRLPPMDQIKAYIALILTVLIAIAFLVSLICMIFDSRHKNMWLHLFLTCLGYVAGILTGLLGILSLPP